MLIMTVFLAVAGIFDHLFHKIPNALILVMLISSVIYACMTSGPSLLPYAVFRMTVTGAVFYLFFVIGAMGAGDVKLLAACSGFMTGTRTLIFIFIAMMIASLYGVTQLCIRKEFGKRMRRLELYIGNLLKTGKVQRYHCSREAAVRNGVALAGPMFLSALIGIGGLY
ncbi:MAG: prepilin peptidase [Lachnospiraceae bacterium]|nr:prepilin peptidase [Lachnospiraceae bacterium]